MMTTRATIRTRGDLAGRDALVLGLARSGVALARYLVDAGARVTVYDRRAPDDLADAVAALDGRAVRLALGVDAAAAVALVEDATLIFTSPSVSPHFPTTEAWLREALVRALERGAELVSEVELFLRLTRARTIGVTGTKGKTTTTALIGAMLDAAEIPHEVGGNIGRPLVELADDLGPEDWAVLELSELQLPTISRGTDVAVTTNILEDHLDRHGTVEAYRAVKARLTELAPPGARVILNRDDPASRELGERLRTVPTWFGVRDGVEARVDAGWVVLEGEPLLAVVDVPLPGEHMLGNVLAAALAAAEAGASHPQIAAAVRAFGGVPHRLEPIAERGGIRYVNDSQATIPIAAIAALRAFAPSPIVLISGGQGKGLDLAAFADEVAARARAAVLMGETAPELAAAIDGRVPVERAGSMDEAVALARRRAQPGDVVLLAPAATSFDMFSDYAARGDAFRRAVDAELSA
ncbi:MAG: UDP-N-acetylmuramoyl-L-alanine--D-glutamate ligase [Chloroflexota bacterium]